MKAFPNLALLTFLLVGLILLTGCASEPNFPPGLPSGEVIILPFGFKEKPGARFDFETGKIEQLTFDGNGDIINGTFDWVYEEEFGCRDGFRWSGNAKNIAFWQLDASEIGTYYMINNTDSVYSSIIPLQYPKVGRESSACKVGIVNSGSGEINWIAVPGGEKENYIPAIQWIDNDRLLIQKLNRKQNRLSVYVYTVSSDTLKSVYTETEDTWVDIGYPDVSSNQWGENDLSIVDNGTAFLRLTENDGWRHIYKITGRLN